MDSAKPNKNAKLVSLFLWLFILTGGVVVCIGGWILVRSLQCTGWPIVAGVIRTSEIIKESGGKHGPTYAPHVSYDYTVVNSKFTAEKIAFGMMSSSSSYARGYLQKYPVGKNVLVYYNPANPSEAVLETGIHGGTWICFGVGTLFILIASVMLKLIKSGSVPLPPENTAAQSKTLQRLVGVIVLMMGVSTTIAGYANRPANLLPIAGVGAVFSLVGLYLIFYRPQENSALMVLRVAIVVILLGVFNWVVFGMAERVVTPTTNTTKIDTFSACIVLLLDAAFAFVAIVALKRKLRNTRRF